jgi:peptidoglycan hydrolase FlgJ
MMGDALALNPQSLDNLRFQAKQDGGKKSIHAAASQFESFFLQMMLRSMRQTLPQDGPFDSRESKMFGDMYDQQIAQNIAQGPGIGLADMLTKQMQLSSQTSVVQPRPYSFPAVPAHPAAGEAAEQAPPAPSADAKDTVLGPGNFVNKLWPHAVDAAAELGVSPHVLLAQAALETGWGKHELRGARGNSYNLFNIKAGKNWTGAKVGAETTEYVNGKPVQQSANFKAYGSYGEAFADYARQIKTNPRYAGALAQGGDAQGFVQGLQSGGYATDPMYASKVMRVINSAAFRDGLSADAASVPAA